MKLRITVLSILISSIIYSQGLNTRLRDNAGAPTTESGFYQTQNPQNYPSGAGGWWHLLDVRHTNATNNYGMQFAGAFGYQDQDLWFRKTFTANTTDDTTAWRKVIMQSPSGYIPLGEASLSFQDNTAFTVSPSDISGSISASVSMPQYGILAPVVNGGAEVWISGFKGIRMFTGGQAKPKFIITTYGDAALQGKLEAKEVRVTQTPTADFVFEETYGLPRLEDVEKHIKEKKHLPEIASAKEMEKEGVNVGEFQIKLLQKIEELTLYSIEQNKKIKALESENIQIKLLLERIEKIESKIH